MKFLLGILIASSFFLTSCKPKSKPERVKKIPIIVLIKETPAEEADSPSDTSASAETSEVVDAVDEEGSPSDTASQIDGAPTTETSTGEGRTYKYPEMQPLH